MSKLDSIPKSFIQGKTVTPLAVPYPNEDTPTAQAGDMLLVWEAEVRLRALQAKIATLTTELNTVIAEVNAIQAQLGPPMTIPGNVGEHSPLLILGSPTGAGNAGIDFHNANSFLDGQIYSGGDANGDGGGAGTLTIATNFLQLANIPTRSNSMTLYQASPLIWVVAGYPLTFQTSSPVTFQSQGVNSIPVIIQGFAGQIADLLDIVDNNNNKLAGFNNAGTLFLSGPAAGSPVIESNYIGSGGGSYVFKMTADGSLYWGPSAGFTATTTLSGNILETTCYTGSGFRSSPGSPTLYLFQSGGQTANLLSLAASAGGFLGGIDANGRFYMGSAGPSWGGGVGPMMFLGEATTNPTTAPTGGGVLYVSTTGALHYRGPSTDTQLAPA